MGSAQVQESQTHATEDPLEDLCTLSIIERQLVIAP